MSRGMSQKTFANLVKVKPASVCKWSAGECLPEAHRVPIIANALNMSADRLTEVLAETFEKHV